MIEDYLPLLDSVNEVLQEEGYAVDTSADGKEGLWYALHNQYDLIILDIMLPGMDGWQILAEVRKKGLKTPVLMLTARDTKADIVKGLDIGADDYLVKPFAMEELLARIRSLIRRSYDQAQSALTLGPITLDLQMKRLSVTETGKSIELTPREFSIFECLALEPGKVISRKEVWHHLYAYEEMPDSNVVDVYVGYLRKKLKQYQLDHMLCTKRGFGYYLTLSEDQ